MCNALAGNADEGPASRIDISSGVLRDVFNCGNAGSELHLIKEGEHALDLCIAEELCLSGTPESAALTSESISSMLSWIGEASSESSPLQDGTTTGVQGRSGGRLGAIVLMLLLLGNIARTARRLPVLS
jgi:hypothetical protein